MLLIFVLLLVRLLVLLRVHLLSPLSYNSLTLLSKVILTGHLDGIIERPADTDGNGDELLLAALFYDVALGDDEPLVRIRRADTDGRCCRTPPLLGYLIRCRPRQFHL